jgi:hypothetical protein
MVGTSVRHRAAVYLGLGRGSTTGRQISLFPWWAAALLAVFMVWGVYRAVTRTEWWWVAVDAFAAVVIGWTAVVGFRQRRV